MRALNNNNFQFNDDLSYGNEFEDQMAMSLSQAYPKNIIKVTGTDLDIKQGTDIVYKTKSTEIRMDATLNFDHKDNTPFMCETDLKLPGTDHNILLGIRLGNSHKGRFNEFDKPVVVIGVNMDAEEFRNTYSNKMYDEFASKRNADFPYDLMEKVEEAYNDYMTTQDRDKKLDAEPLQLRNSKWRMPQKISKENKTRILTQNAKLNKTIAKNDPKKFKTDDCFYSNNDNTQDISTSPDFN